MRPTFIKVVFCMAITLLVSPSYAGILGTYKGGFESRRLSISVELRCDGSGLCEDDQTVTSDGQSASSTPQKWELKPLGGCATPPTSEWDECEGRLWDGVRKALDFARKNIEEQDNPDQKNQLRPFLTSDTDISQCYAMPGQAVLCEIKSSPWGKPALLYMPSMLQPCYPPSGFCTYTIIPLFKTRDDGVLQSKTSGVMTLYPKGPWPGEVEQEKVAPYIRQLEELVHAHLVLPSGTPNTARLTVLIQFDGDTGRISYASPLSASINTGCSCPDFRQAATKAAYQVAKLPLLPIEERGHVGGGRGRVYLRVVAGKATAPAPTIPVAIDQAYPPFHKSCQAKESVDLGKNKRGDRVNSTLVQCAEETYAVLGTASDTPIGQKELTWIARKVHTIPKFNDKQVTQWSHDCRVRSSLLAASGFVVVISEWQPVTAKTRAPRLSYSVGPDIDALNFQVIPISLVHCEYLGDRH